jgi:hypothetical protein
MIPSTRTYKTCTLEIGLCLIRRIFITYVIPAKKSVILEYLSIGTATYYKSNISGKSVSDILQLNQVSVSQIGFL